MTSWPARAPPATPSGPNRTASTSGVSETQTTTTSVARATAAGVSARATPSASSSGARSGTAVPGRDGEPGPGEVGGHRRAHRAQPQEADPFAAHRPSRCCYARPHHATRSPAGWRGATPAWEGPMPLVAQLAALLAAAIHVWFFVLESVALQPAARRGPVRAHDAGADRRRPADGLQPGLLQPVPGRRDRGRASPRSPSGAVDRRPGDRPLRLPRAWSGPGSCCSSTSRRLRPGGADPGGAAARRDRRPHCSFARRPRAGSEPRARGSAHRVKGYWRARRDSNPRPSGPQPDALSTELRAHACRRHRPERTRRKLAEREGFEPSEQVTPLNGLANRRTRPLCDLSVARRPESYHGPRRRPAIPHSGTLRR